MSTESGFITVARDMLDHPVFDIEAFCEPMAWLWLIREASWKPKNTVRVGKAIVELDRGECASTVRFMATRWNWSKSRVGRYLKRLENCGLIVIKSDTLVTRITICNYDKYQLGGNSCRTVAGQEGDSSGTNKKERKEIKQSIGDANASSARGTRLPANWILPDAWKEYALGKGLPAGRVTIEAERFHNFYLSKAGKDGAKSDWLATWRNWILKALDDFKPAASTKAKLFGRM